METMLNINGFMTKVSYSEKEIQTLFYPILNELIKRRKEKNGRLIVYLAAPPGTGKTTLSLFLKKLFDQLETPYSFQVLSIDGFHYDRDYLTSHYITRNGTEILLNNVKGSPESFNLEALTDTLKDLRDKPVNWPVYDRTIHDVSEETITADADIVLIEGNWLLLNEEKWNELEDYCDISLFIEADQEVLKQRLINRKIRGGLSPEEAEIFYRESDGKNVERVLRNHFNTDIVLKLTSKEELVKG